MYVYCLHFFVTGSLGQLGTGLAKVLRYVLLIIHTRRNYIYCSYHVFLQHTDIIIVILIMHAPGDVSNHGRILLLLCTCMTLYVSGP